MQPECRQHPTAQPEGLSKDYSARYSRGILSLSNYGPYKPCNPWHLSAGLVMVVLGLFFCLRFLCHSSHSKLRWLSWELRKLEIPYSEVQDRNEALPTNL